MNEPKLGWNRVLLGVFLIGLVCRLPYVCRPGFQQDMLYYRSCAEYLSKHSVPSIYAHADQIAGGVVNYPPVYLYILQILGRFACLFTENPFQTTGFLVLIKSINILADLGTALCLFYYLKRTVDISYGILGFAFFWLNPAVIYLGSHFGQTDTIFSFYLVLSAILLQTLPLLGGIFCGVALGMKMQALPLLPLFFLLPLLEKKFRAFLMTALGFSISLAALLLPFYFTQQLSLLIRSCFWEPMQWGTQLTYGAWNLWQLHADPSVSDQLPFLFLFGSDGALPADSVFLWFSYHRFGFVLFVISYFLIVFRFCFWRGEESSRFWWALSAISLVFFFFPTRIHERYLFPFFVFAVPLTVVGGSGRRIGYAVLSVFFLLNLMTVCPPDSRLVSLTEVHVGDSDILALVGLLTAALWIKEQWSRTGRVSWTLLAVFGLLLMAGLIERRTAPLPLSAYTSRSWIQEWKRPQRDLSIDGNLLRVGNRVYARGIGTHAPSRIVFDVPENAERVTGWIGPDASVVGGYERTSIVFAVELDGNEVFRSSKFMARSAAQKIEIPLSGRRELALIVEDGSDGNKDDLADWCGLFLEYKQEGF